MFATGSIKHPKYAHRTLTLPPFKFRPETFNTGQILSVIVSYPVYDPIPFLV